MTIFFSHTVVKVKERSRKGQGKTALWQWLVSEGH